jgi:hypothetical protein
MTRVLPLLLLAACATGSAAGSDPDPDPDAAPDPGPGPDAAAPAPDAAPDPAPDAAPPPAAPAAPLLLTEITAAPTGAEMIEVGNPTDLTIDLADYYLADVGAYFQLPAGDATADVSDFIVRFPAGATLAPGEVVVVALDTAAAFTAATGAAPDYSVADATMVSVAGSAATLTNGGELVALFFWDGASDLVTDVDLMVFGAPTAANGAVAKSGVALDGPDANSATSAYAAEAGALAAQPAAPAAGASTKRVLLETGYESAAAGGNGPDGQDETSEATGTTWDTTFTAPTPGTTALAL